MTLHLIKYTHGGSKTPYRSYPSAIDVRLSFLNLKSLFPKAISFVSLSIGRLDIEHFVVCVKLAITILSNNSYQLSCLHKSSIGIVN